MLAKVDSKDIETVVNALIKQAKKLPHELYQSLDRTFLMLLTSAGTKLDPFMQEA